MKLPIQPRRFIIVWKLTNSKITLNYQYNQEDSLLYGNYLTLRLH